MQGLVCVLVAAALTNLYLPQPVLPVLAHEFGVAETTASLTISMAILGITLANLPFGALGDRFPIRPLILGGGVVVAICALICAVTTSLPVLVATRFLQGLFFPALTTCLAAYLARNLPPERLNVGMGAYVSATVVGGLGGRLLGGWIHPPLHWRYAFVSAAVLLLLALLAALIALPKDQGPPRRQAADLGFAALLARGETVRIYVVAFSAFWVFSASFNYLPFYLAQTPFEASTELITLLYLTYLLGAVMGPVAGRISNRIGNGATMAWGALLFGLALASTLIASLGMIALSLAGVCAGFFAIHAAAAGALNRKLSGSRGRANSLYVLFYYAGGYCGITVSGYMYRYGGWPAVVALGLAVLLLPLFTGLAEGRASVGHAPIGHG
ncbi:MAG: MFS transporter [Desulfobulbus sp.]|nr:MAG: MFS transporter [Desulfobulbus sp.]